MHWTVSSFLERLSIVIRLYLIFGNFILDSLFLENGFFLVKGDACKQAITCQK